jgi:8-oxo-dGTP pyrophosphatase MutT (NUDIX family)
MDASQLLGSAQIAALIVVPRGFGASAARSAMRIDPAGAAFLPLVMRAGRRGRQAPPGSVTFDTPRFGGYGLLAVTVQEVPVYWTTAGGGVDEGDASVEAAMHREIFEELGATATGASQVFLTSARSESGVKVQYFFVARLTSLDLSVRNGPEIANPAKGRYDPDRVTLLDDGAALTAIDLQPSELKAFVLANRQALLAEAGLVS